MNMPPVQTTYFALKGGLNLVSPPLSIPDGNCRDSLNFDAKIDGGYERIAGYERFDGRTQPHTVSYSIIRASITGSISAGDTINGQTSGATAVVIAVENDYIAVTKITGTFAISENIRKSTTVVAVSSTSAQALGADTQYLDAIYKSLAANAYRADIQAVPGSGSVLGVHRYKGVIYAFRNNAGATNAVMYKSTSSGWVAVDLGREIEFTNANANVNDGDTLTQGGVTATVLRVVLETGALGVANTGRLIISAPTGGNFSAGAATTSGSGTLTLGGAQTQITLPADGKYKFVNYNFGGASTTQKMYGVNSVGRAFEFDGTVFVPIRTGMLNDAPSNIAAHVNFLILSYGASLQKSVIGQPYQWSAVLGAGELAVGDDITNLLPLVGSENTSALLVLTVSKTLVLYGNTADTFQLVTYNHEAGAFNGSAQTIGDAYMIDEMGIRQLSATQNFGNFADMKVTDLIKPFVQARASSFSCSCISRLKNQYRVYYTDGYALHVTVSNGKVIGVMPIRTPNVFTCVTSTESGDGDEWILAGGTDGFVYRLDKGTSFDGKTISAYLSMAFSHQRSPRSRKRYRKAIYEVTANDYIEISAGYELGYGSVDISAGSTLAMESPFGPVFWDEFTWDAFYWDGRTLQPIEQGLDGTGENISLYITCNNNYTKQFTVNSVILHYTIRRQLR